MSHFPNVPVIEFEGSKSKNPFAFKHYNPDEKIGGKKMKDHMRFAAAYWHVMRNSLSDPFGAGTALMPWDDGSDSLDNALRRIPVFFEFLQKCQIDFYCFHDRDISPEGKTLTETHANLARVTKELKAYQKGTGKKLLWGTACLFSPTPATRRARAPRPTPTSSPTAPARSATHSRPPRPSAAKVTSSGAVAKATPR